VISNPTTLLLAGALASPTLWQAAVVGDVTIADAALRYLICVPVAAVMLALLRMVTRDFGRNAHQLRRSADQPAAIEGTAVSGPDLP
jgi:hypothetical protein